MHGSCCNTRNMSDPNTVVKKRRGRPRIGEFPVFSFRFNPDYLEDVDDWRRGEPGNLSRSQAIRELIMRGLSAAYDERKQAARKRGQPLSVRACGDFSKIGIRIKNDTSCLGRE
jgi:hypothetical protein